MIDNPGEAWLVGIAAGLAGLVAAGLVMALVFRVMAP
jgi:hypothetical protein